MTDEVTRVDFRTKAVLALTVVAISVLIRIARHRLRQMRTIAADGRLLTFGYGSNLCLDRLENRLGAQGSARYVATGYLSGRVLRFHKRSQDADGDPVASGKANAA